MPHRFRPSSSPGDARLLLCPLCDEGRVPARTARPAPLVTLPAPVHRPAIRCTHHCSTASPLGPRLRRRTGSGPGDTGAARSSGNVMQRENAVASPPRSQSLRAAGRARRNVRIGYGGYLYRRLARLLTCCRRLMITATRVL
ncbi:hypothetical protein JK359_37500 [Streptomyces actinomycinicus]|uniref:Uncharacterized protein n=1 Tax=Streptomyces actinomycinicus TaxID=1695166 RepID=A0A937ESC0_9ACTN|nr:hypothetical protein [Streptomyces actinomycinicus]MBL1087570.1 hypothetical protein [Streptomyces actinomycinicus]